ncbi:PEP-CTERM sorting domain-containing protein [Aquisphaera insulae]|uniref:PEP-CTERM sorting domain-containing protein n=1 Tax=Aquisphaera insulae TaxID=2712864 RepID=UPI0013E99F76|nr:PEP-CTERM sorting domain-containing protein [Aquisphaera insulae]
MTRSSLALRAAAILTLLAAAGSAHAGLVLSIANLTQPSSGTGTFEVLLTNDELPGGTSYDLAGFSFGLTVPTGSGVKFSAADATSTTKPYIFADSGGAWLESQNPGDPAFAFTFSYSTFPGSDVIASDTEWKFPSITVNPQDVYSLGTISYLVEPGTPTSDVQISFNLDGTSLSGPNDTDPPIPFTTDTSDGVIRIGGTVVPEPSSVVLALAATALLGTARVRLARRRAA